MSAQVSRESRDSVGPAGLGYRAITFPCGELLKKKAISIGIIKPSHWRVASVENPAEIARRAERALYFVPLCASKRIAQAWHAQISLRLAGSTR